MRVTSAVLAGRLVTMVMHLRAIMPLDLFVLVRNAAVLAERHAHAGGHGRDSLRRNGNGQERDGKQAEQAITHWTELYVSCFERRSGAWFLRKAHFLRQSR